MKLQSAKNRIFSPTNLPVLVVCILPIFLVDASSRFLAISCLLYATLAVSWNLTLGISGIANFAHLAFFAIGAYASAVFTSRTNLSPWLGLLIAIVVAAGCGGIAFIPILRLKGIYIALVTFVFSQICFLFVLNQSSWTGGSSGIGGLPTYYIGRISTDEHGRLGLYFIVASYFLFVIFLIDYLMRRPFGKSLIALRDNELYAKARGIPAFRQHLIAFIISAAMAGGVGALYAHFLGIVSPTFFGFNYTALVLSMVFLGGVGSLRGPIFGAVLIVIIYDKLNTQGLLRSLIVSAVVVLVIRFMPTGIAGLMGQIWSRNRGKLNR